MSIFEWSTPFETGIQEVDHQHHKLVDIINTYGGYSSEDTVSYHQTIELLEQLLSYADKHFNDEEQLMLDKGIDGEHYNIHVQAHIDFKEEVQEMLINLTPETPDAANFLCDYLVNWLGYHILGMDQVMSRQFTLISEGMSASDAYKTAKDELAPSTEPLLNALSGLFNQVATKSRELKKLNSELERKVEERTVELSRANEMLKTMSLTDTLTELPNRRHAMSMLEHFWQEATKHQTDFVCIMIDADHFKEVNDTYGHPAGDKVLIELGRTLVHTFRNDDLVCRLGGDEFLVICPSTNLQGGMEVANIVRKRVSELRVATGGAPWKGSISVGVAAMNKSVKNLNELIKMADQSVYEAKRAGKQCVRSIQISELTH